MPIHFTQIFERDLLDKMIDEKFIRSVRHPSEPLTLFSYTERAQYEGVWNEATNACRGLIVHDSGIIWARPFSKFHNWGAPEAPNIEPWDSVEVSDKKDGCFPYGTVLNCWDGTTVLIGDVVSKRLTPTLIGMDSLGRLVPSVVTGWHRNGIKDNWLMVTVSNRSARNSGSGGYKNALQITANHKVFSGGIFKPAGDLRPGDPILHPVFGLDDIALHVVRSGLLGDGSLSPVAGGSFVYADGHKAEHSEYTAAIRSWLGPSASNRSDTTSGYGTKMTWAGTRWMQSLSGLRSEWYPSGNKVVPMDLSWIDDFSIAKWYMDDGSLVHSDLQEDRASFATNGFTEPDVARLAKVLSDRYSIDAVVGHSKGYYIRVNASRSGSINRLWEAISPHIVPVMRYKLPERWRDIRYANRQPGSLINIPSVATVDAVCAMEPKPYQVRQPGRYLSGFDITTETSNFTAKGVMVHNSLGICYRLGNGSLAIATRGSFTSPQAERATALLGQMLASGDHPASVNNDVYTHMFEIVYPENRIVIDYGDTSTLFYLGSIDIRSGLTAAIPPDARVMEFGEAIRLPPRPNAEGLVVRKISTDQRIKLKQEDYRVLHRIITQCSARTLWEHLAVNDLDSASRARGAALSAKQIGNAIQLDAKRVEEILMVGPEWKSALVRDGMPLSFVSWVEKRSSELRAETSALEDLIVEYFKIACEASGSGSDRKRFAAQCSTNKHRAALFGLLDGVSPRAYCWRATFPGAELPFASIGE